jgi:hypothetical protein
MVMSKTKRIRPQVQQELCENDYYQGRFEPQHKDKEEKYLKKRIWEEAEWWDEEGNYGEYGQ